MVDETIITYNTSNELTIICAIFQLKNTAALQPRRKLATLHNILKDMKTCQGAMQCTNNKLLPSMSKYLWINIYNHNI